jgi:uncharacterized membrane protein YhaH (DUF805 family)
VRFDQVIEAAQAGRLEPRTDMLFGGDLEDWVPAGEVDGVFEKVNPEDSKQASQALEATEAEKALADSGDFADDRDEQTHIDLPGAHRIGYFFGVTLLPTVLIIGLSKLMPVMIEVGGAKYGGYAPYVFLLVPLVVLIVTLKRFQNLSMSGWWWLGLGVPILQLWLYYRLFACPPGYAFTKKLDVAGKVMAVLYWLAVVGSLAAMVVFGTIIAKKSSDEEFQEQMQKIRNQIESWEFQAKKQKDEAGRQ